MTIDVQLFHLLNSLAGQSALGDQVIVFLGSYLPYGLIALFPILVATAHISRIHKIYILAEAALAALIARFGVTELIRVFIHRPRPFLVETPVHQLLTETSWSFPSGHATFFFALATTVYLYNKRWGAFFYLAATLLSLSRVAAGVHYPTDILAGALVGVLIAQIAYILGRRIKIRTSQVLDS
jgi:undecaprenyl-diphosphatase